MAAETIGFKAGRTWTEDANGITSLERVYIVKRDQTANEETSLPGVPAVGSQHPSISGLYVKDRKIREGEGSDRGYLLVTVTYESTASSSAAGGENKVPRGQDIQSWGWRHGSVTRDVCTDRATGNLITNSAGQPFDSVPQFEVASPVFTKVVKTLTHRNWREFANKVNAAQVTINGEVFDACTLRCIQVDEEKLWNDEFGFEWQYTIGVQYLSNKVCIQGQGDKTEIGWDTAITDAGCYELKQNGLERISWIDRETKKLVYATTPQLLNGQGERLTGNDPYNFRFQLYEQTTFPEEFFKIEPYIILAPEEDDE